MDLGLRGRHALVCASTAGLGEAVARRLAEEGARVVVCGRRGGLARSIAAELPEAIGVEADLADPAGADRLLAAATEAYGPVEVLVTNGPGPDPGAAQELDGDDVLQAVRSLVVPQQRLVSGVLPGMRARGWGRILAIASVGVAAPIPGLVRSNVGRAALAGYLKTLATEVAVDGVTVNMLLPGRISTDRTTQMTAYRAQKEGVDVEVVERRTRAAVPAGRLGTPEEFSAYAAFLCSAPASYVTGTAVRCDGGVVPTL